LQHVKKGYSLTLPYSLLHTPHSPLIPSSLSLSLSLPITTQASNMVGRSLLSLLVAATVAIQSCAAAAVEDGNYVISNQNGRLQVGQAKEGSPAFVSDEGFEVWRVENRYDDDVLIRNLNTGLLLSSQQLGVPDSKVIVTSKKSIWHLRREDDQSIVIEEPHNTGLIAGEQDGEVVTVPSFVGQTWRFYPVLDFKHETQHRCGPWRLESDSLYLQ
ncbi:hypothetical protein B0O80DRAFT_247725, partial [Mortierella sp. GBAus27b]